MKVVFMGTPDFAETILSKLLTSRHRVLAVVTQPDKPVGRGKKISFSPVKETALKVGIPVLQPQKMRSEETFKCLAKYEADAFVVAAFGRIIPDDLLNLPRYGCINVHASLLPKYRGAAPIQRAILAGEEKTGVTIMKINERLDSGDIFSQREMIPGKKETSESLFDKLAYLGADLLVETLDGIENGSCRALPQPEESPTPYAKMITKSDARIDWKSDAQSIERQVRAMNSWPCAYSVMNGSSVKIWDCDVIETDSKGTCGEIISACKDALIIQTGSGRIKINELQLEGKKRMAAEAFLRGSRWKEGMQFEN